MHTLLPLMGTAYRQSSSRKSSPKSFSPTSYTDSIAVKSEQLTSLSSASPASLTTTYETHSRTLIYLLNIIIQILFVSNCNTTTLSRQWPTNSNTRTSSRATTSSSSAAQQVYIQLPIPNCIPSPLTSCPSGIGYAVAEACLENGCTVTISSSNPSRIQAAVTKLQKSYPSYSKNISGHACDLSSPQNLEENLKTLLETTTSPNSQGRKLQHIIFTAGDALATVPVSSLSMDKISTAGQIRFFAPLMLSKLAPSYLSPGPQSSLTLTTGAVSERPIPNWTLVNAYATGLQGMTRGLALDLAPIRVNLISPGVVDTELWAGMSKEQKEGMFAEMVKKIPVGKVGQPEDVAESYLYCMRDRNVTGAMVSTSGGHLLTG